MSCLCTHSARHSVYGQLGGAQDTGGRGRWCCVALVFKGRFKHGGVDPSELKTTACKIFESAWANAISSGFYRIGYIYYTPACVVKRLAFPIVDIPWLKGNYGSQTLKERCSPFGAEEAPRSRQGVMVDQLAAGAPAPKPPKPPRTEGAAEGAVKVPPPARAMPPPPGRPPPPPRKIGMGT